jgi:hypothetical protein
MRHHPGNRRPDVRRFGQGLPVSLQRTSGGSFSAAWRTRPASTPPCWRTVRRRAAGKTSCISIYGKPFSQSLSGEGGGEALLKVASTQTLELG